MLQIIYSVVVVAAFVFIYPNFYMFTLKKLVEYATPFPTLDTHSFLSIHTFLAAAVTSCILSVNTNLLCRLH